MTTRPARDNWAMQMAVLTATRTTCLRRGVGAVLLNERGHILATGYNGVAAGQPHCNELVRKPVYEDDPRVKIVAVDGKDHFDFKGDLVRKLTVHPDENIVQCAGFEPSYPHACTGATAPSGQNLDGCHAIHAEQNALLQCRDIYAIDICYVTVSPCMTCAKLLLNTSCRRIVYLSEYTHLAAKDLWESSGRLWEKYHGNL